MFRLQTIAIFCLSVLKWGYRSGVSVSEIVETDSAEVLELDSIPAEYDVSIDAKLWADSIMDVMTLEEMIGQLIMPAVYADVSYASMRLVKQYATDDHVGGVVLLKGSVSAAKTIADTLRRLLPAPPFIAIDAEWGLSMRLEGTPEFPRNGRISADAEETLLLDYGYEVA